MLEEITLQYGHRGLALSNDAIRAVVLPDKGCDIFSVTDRESGIDVLFKSPWGLMPQGPGVSAPNSAANWLRHYPGGWQVILPNGGADATVAGSAWGFHGEACLAGWSWEEAEGGLDAATRLFYAPLEIRREIRLADDGSLRLQETVTNDSPDPISFMWGHHPAFGRPLVEPGARIATGARTYVADDEQPGHGIEPNSRHAWPQIRTEDGATLDLSIIPDEAVARLGYLTDFDEHWFAITNPRLELGVAMRWSAGVLDHAWFWQELDASQGFPWFRRAYVTAIEPNSTFPAQGAETAKDKGGTLVDLDGGASATVTIALTLFHGSGAVVGIADDGSVLTRE